MQNNIFIKSAAILVLLPGIGCQYTDRLTFTTSTELAASADPATGQLNIGYDRSEMVIAPNNPATGDMPSVVASLKSNGSPFSPRVEQVFATGKAADAAANSIGGVIQPFSVEAATLPEQEERRVVVFGTSTNVGLNASFAGEGLPSVVFGYKRRESAVIPMSEEATDVKKTSSVLAAISVGANVSTVNESDLTVEQFMATGAAAEKLAGTKCVQENLKAEAAVATAGEMLTAKPAADQLAANSANRLSECARPEGN